MSSDYRLLHERKQSTSEESTELSRGVPAFNCNDLFFFFYFLFLGAAVVLELWTLLVFNMDNYKKNKP